MANWISGSGAEAAASDHPVAPAGEQPCSLPPELSAAGDEPVPPDLRTEIGALVASDAIAERQVSISIWVDGWGEVVAHQPDLALRPASNQKILVAAGALGILDHDRRLHTSVAATTTPVAGRIHGDLVLAGGGDPTLWDVGPHSIYEMASDLRDLGVTEVTGALYVDESRYDSRRMAPGWTDQQIPGDATPISALTVAANRIDDSYEYLANPAAGNGEVFLRYLSEVGVGVRGGLATGPAPEASHELVSVTSPTVAELVQMMLRNSDNTTAELLVKEIGLEAAGEGSTGAGLAAARSVVERWCLELSGVDDDGSGLSYDNLRSAREWRQILQLSRNQPWWPVMRDGLPAAGDPGGTLANRLTGPATEGNVRAKTGTIAIARALSGVFTTAGGREATFSIIINDEADPGPAVDITDRIIETIAAHPG